MAVLQEPAVVLEVALGRLSLVAVACVVAVAILAAAVVAVVEFVAVAAVFAAVVVEFVAAAAEAVLAAGQRRYYSKLLSASLALPDLEAEVELELDWEPDSDLQQLYSLFSLVKEDSRSTHLDFHCCQQAVAEGTTSYYPYLSSD